MGPGSIIIIVEKEEEEEEEEEERKNARKLERKKERKMMHLIAIRSLKTLQEEVCTERFPEATGQL